MICFQFTSDVGLNLMSEKPSLMSEKPSLMSDKPTWAILMSDLPTFDIRRTN